MFVLGRSEADQFQRGMRALFHLRFGFGLGEYALDREIHILKTRQPRQQRMILKHDRAIGSGAFHFPIRQQHHTAGRIEEARDHVQERRFAAARVADETDKFALVDIQIHVAQRLEAASLGVEFHADGFNREKLVHGSILTPDTRN